MKAISPAITILSITLLGLATSQSTAASSNKKGLSNEKLLDEARAWDVDSISELGRRKHAPAKAELKKLLTLDPPADSRAEDARIKTLRHEHNQEKVRRAREMSRRALARLGDEGLFQEYIQMLRSTDSSQRTNAIVALGYIGDDRAVPYLAPLLFEKGGLPSRGDEYFPTYAEYAAEALAAILPSDFEDLKRMNGGKKYGLEGHWRDWWQRRKKDFK